MKYTIYRIQVFVGVLLSIVMFSGCEGGVAPIANFEQKGETKELQQGETLDKADKKEVLFPPRLFTYEQARKKYISEFGEPSIAINKGSDGRLAVKIITKNTVLASANPGEALLYYEHIYGSKQVMEKFATGQTRDLEYAKTRLNTWNKRFEQGNPFAGLTAILKASGEFIGNVVLGGADEKNSAELAYFLKEDKWNQRLGTEIVGAVVLFYAPLLVKENFKLPDSGQHFERTIATCRIDNTASKKILDYMGMGVYEINNKFGNDRYLYELSMKEVN